MTQDPQDSTPSSSDAVEDLRSRLAANIERLKLEQEISWPVLEQKSGVSRIQIYNIRTSKKAATVDVIAKLARAFDVEPHLLLK